MVAWYKHDIPAWMNGTENLDAGSYRVYHVICQLIYLNEGPVERNERGIAGRCNMHILAFRKCIDHLLTLGKLTLNPDGTLDQPRANLELRKIGTNRINAGLGGSAPRKSLKNNDRYEATLKEKTTEKTREDQTREEETIKIDPPLRVVDDWPDDFGDVFWQAYPRKTEKLSAMKRLSGLRKSGIVTFKDLMAGVSRYAAVVSRNDPQFTKHPTTWLNAGCWADEIQPGATNGTRNFDQKRGSASASFFAGIANLAADISGHDQPSGDEPSEIPLGRFNING